MDRDGYSKSTANRNKAQGSSSSSGYQSYYPNHPSVPHNTMQSHRQDTSSSSANQPKTYHHQPKPANRDYRDPYYRASSYNPSAALEPPKVLSSSNNGNISQPYHQGNPYGMRQDYYACALNLHRPNSPYWKKKTDPTYKPSAGIPPPSAYMMPQRVSQPKHLATGTYDTYGSSAALKGNTEQDLRDLLSSIEDDDAPVDREHQPPEVTVNLLPHQLKGVAWMKSKEASTSRGGILADDMGLGKTVQTISLIVANRSENKDCKTTLVVAPLALIKQWEHEVSTKTKKGTLSVLVYHGQSRTKDPAKLKRYDVVITTYQVIASEWPKQIKSKKGENTTVSKPAKPAGPLYSVKWYRVVLDEAQTIKNKSTRGAIGCCALQAERRFCLSGTPLQNNVDELYSLLKFLEFKPFNDHAVFKAQISEPLGRGRSKVALERLRVIMQAIMLRRTKTTKIDGRPLLNLPARNVALEKVLFTAEEQDYYNQLEQKMKRKLNSFKQAGYSRNYTNILCLLLRLRQACNHRFLVGHGADKEGEIKPEEGTAEEEDVDEMMAMFKGLEVNADNRQCTVCFEPLSGVPPEQKQCGDCREKFVKSEAAKMSDSSAGKKGKGSVLTNELSKDWVPSAKLAKMMEILDNVKAKHPDDKTIIFSQFTSMLDVAEIPLRKKGYKFCRYDGSMPNPERERSIDAIRNDKEVTVMLISLKCGSLGLNLTAANRVIMLDMWWNPALEDQAIDRVHRIGQTKPVEVVRLAIEGTVEDRILELQNKKRELVEGALGDANFKKAKKMTIDELVGLFG